MKKLYAEKGYLKADIQVELVKSSKMSNIFDGKAKAITKDIIFNIKENEILGPRLRPNPPALTGDRLRRGRAPR